MIIESDNYGTIYNIGSGKSYSLKSMLEYVISLCSQSIMIEVDPMRIRQTDQPIICCDHSLISSELNWKPYYTISDILNELFEYYLNI